MNLVVDASVAVKWVVQEEDRDRARALLLDENNVLIAPAFLMIEVANVLGIKVSKGQMEPSQAEQGLQTIRGNFADLIPTKNLPTRLCR